MEGDSEIGDKTFFVAALFAMKTSRIVAFVGAMGALVSMTAIAVVLGRLFSSIKIPALHGLKVARPTPASRGRASRKGKREVRGALGRRLELGIDGGRGGCAWRWRVRDGGGRGR
jgi:hypothetical protein